MKYHVTAAIVNAIIITIVLNLFQEVYKIFDGAYFAKKGHHFANLFIYSLFFFSWMATFIIYKVKNYRKHFYYFIVINLFVGIIICSSQYIYFVKDVDKKFHLKYLIGTNWDAIKETIVPLLAVSILVHITQNFIGKKLLPEEYKPLD